MQYRRLGKSPLVVSALGLACVGMSQMYGPPRDEAEAIGGPGGPGGQLDGGRLKADRRGGAEEGGDRRTLP